jgi:hypothetical protein
MDYCFGWLIMRWLAGAGVLLILIDRAALWNSGPGAAALHHWRRDPLL